MELAIQEAIEKINSLNDEKSKTSDEITYENFEKVNASVLKKILKPNQKQPICTNSKCINDAVNKGLKNKNNGN